MGIVQVLEVAHDIDDNVIGVGEKVMDRVADGAWGMFLPVTIYPKRSCIVGRETAVAIHRIEDYLDGLTRLCSPNSPVVCYRSLHTRRR
jgi:hypothetical protein